MATRPFAVFSLGVRGTILGDLTVQTGCRVQLVVSLAPDKSRGLCYDVAFEATGIRPAEAAFTRRCMESAFLTFSLDEVDPASDTWRAVGRLAIENVDPPLLRTIMEGPMDAAPVWLVMDGGWAQVRLQPMLNGSVLQFAKDVQAFLRTRDHRADVAVADIEPAWYHQALGQLHASEPGEPSIDDEPLLTP